MPTQSKNNAQIRPDTESSRRRDEILDAAGHLFALKGITATTVRDIADSAGILSGSLYHHFRTKDEMVLDIMVPYLDAKLAAYEQILASNTAPLLAFRAMLAAGVQGTANAPHVARLVQSERAVFATNPAYRPIQDKKLQIQAIWRGAIEAGIATGDFVATIEPSIIYMTIFDVLTSCGRWVGPDGSASVGDITDQLFILFTAGIVSAPTTKEPSC